MDGIAALDRAPLLALISAPFVCANCDVAAFDAPPIEVEAGHDRGAYKAIFVPRGRRDRVARVGMAALEKLYLRRAVA